MTDPNGDWVISYELCPSPLCGHAIVHLLVVAVDLGFGPMGQEPPGIKRRLLVFPKGSARPVPSEVPAQYAGDFKEACLVLPDSPKASAALSRRCLQAVLRDKAKTKAKDLADQIQEVIDSGKCPSYLTESLDGIRNYGNFAAHPLKSTASGQILDVEPGEAEWSLDTLEAAFDFYFVQPAVTQRKRDALNNKLKAAGKPPMK
jgi:Domain of unknown function (DUF4145)